MNNDEIDAEIANASGNVGIEGNKLTKEEIEEIKSTLLKMKDSVSSEDDVVRALVNCKEPGENVKIK